MIRKWVDVYRIWKADSQEEFERVVNEGKLADDNIKREYRPFEEKYAHSHGIFNSEFGDEFMLFHPGFALSSMLVSPFGNERYRQDVGQLIQDEKVGLTLLPGIGPFLQASRKETPGGRRVQYGPDGEVTGYEDVVTLDDREGYKAPILKVIDSIKSIFENVERPPEPNSPLPTIEDPVEASAEFVKWMEREGAFSEIKNLGQELYENRKKQFEEIIQPASVTIQKMANLSVAQTPDEFERAMLILASSNKIFKDLNPGKFSEEIDRAVGLLKSNPEVIDQLSKNQENEDKQEISDSELKNIAFIQVRNVFTKNTIEFLEEFYELYRDHIMSGMTEKGLEKIKKTDLGRKYAKLIEGNIQLLDNALQSMKRINPQGDL